MGRIFYIMGKSATGKDHIYNALLQDKALQLFPLVLYTTRPMREGEQEGREYFFVDEARAQRMREKGQIIEERVYDTVYGPWRYFTADEGQIDLDAHDYLGIGTPESYLPLRRHFGKDAVVPLYIETEDGIRLGRALKREAKQNPPKYDEMCRRYLADCEDFSEERLKAAGITRRFSNDGMLEDCISEVTRAICEAVSAARGSKKGCAGTERTGNEGT